MQLGEAKEQSVDTKAISNFIGSFILEKLRDLAKNSAKKEQQNS